jgi:hypothetical protein
VDEQDYDAIVLAYGLCGKATENLTARGLPIVVPRAHDCITLFLGSRERYNAQFMDKPGTYWYALDYIERRDGPGTTLSLGSDVDTDLPAVYDEYVEKYGKRNADYLMEVMGAWKEHYQRAVYIDMGVGEGGEVEAQTRDESSRRGWTFERLAGDLTLVRRLLDGDWDGDFLILQPGQKLTMAHNDGVIDGVAPE